MELRDLWEPDTILNVSAHAFMIVGLKYVGEADDLPTRVPVGDVVKLRREPCEQSDPGAVTAFYGGRKVGYLSPEKQALWDSLKPSTRDRAKVTGEILDEDGDLAGLDIQIDAECDERPRVAESAVAVKSMRMKGLGIIVGIAVLSLTLTVGADSTDPAIPAIGTETRKTQQLADYLRQARVVAAHQRLRIEELERQTRTLATYWHAENRKLANVIAELQQRIEKMTLIAQQRQDEERNEIALTELNREELVRRNSQLAAWTLMARKLAPATKKTKSAVRQAPDEPVSAPSMLRTEKTTKKKTNFSRYAQENRDSNGQEPERFAR